MTLLRDKQTHREPALVICFTLECNRSSLNKLVMVSPVVLHIYKIGMSICSVCLNAGKDRILHKNVKINNYSIYIQGNVGKDIRLALHLLIAPCSCIKKSP